MRVSSIALSSCLLAFACGDDGGGSADSPDAMTSAPDARAGSVQWVQLAGGGDHTCAIDTDKNVWCWGLNESGQLSQTGMTESTKPVMVEGLKNIVAIAAGWKHTCAIQSDGVMLCWGANDLGQLGNSTTDDQLIPAPVTGMTDAVALAAGDAHTCAVKTDGTVWCWGLNADGQLGDGSVDDHISPAQVTGVTGATTVGAGFFHACASTDAGKVFCWGENLSLQLGPGGGDNDSLSTPVEVTGAALAGTSSVTCGDAHSCAIAGGDVVCWGENTKGQIGNDSVDDIATPTKVAGISGAISVGGGRDHTCAATTSQVFCWGSNGFDDPEGVAGFVTNGKIGQPVSTQEIHIATPVTGVSNATNITTGDHFTCASAGSDTLCWGLNDVGALGTGNKENAFTPTKVVQP